MGWHPEWDISLFPSCNYKDSNLSSIKNLNLRWSEIETLDFPHQRPISSNCVKWAAGGYRKGADRVRVGAAGGYRKGADRVRVGAAGGYRKGADRVRVGAAGGYRKGADRVRVPAAALTWFLSSSHPLNSSSPSLWNVTITKPTKMLTMKNAMMMM